MNYAELAVTTNFSFLPGASHPEELVAEAARLGLTGIGMADRNTVAGVVRAHVAMRETEAAAEAGLRLVVGARLVFADGTPDIVAYPEDRAAWGRLPPADARQAAGARRASATRARRSVGRRGGSADRRAAAPAGAAAMTGSPPTLARLAEAAPGRRLARRHHAAWRGPDRRRLARLAELAARGRRAAGRHQRRALPRARAPPAAGRADLHPRERPPSTRPAGGWRPMPSATSSRRPRWRACSAPCPEAVARRCASRALPLLARRAALRISRRARAAGQDARRSTSWTLTWEGAARRYPGGRARKGAQRRSRRSSR